MQTGRHWIRSLVRFASRLAALFVLLSACVYKVITVEPAKAGEPNRGFAVVPVVLPPGTLAFRPVVREAEVKTLREEAEREIAEQRKKGDELFHCPSIMRVNTKTYCVLRIASEQMVGDILAGFEKRAGLRVERVDISPSMKARLWGEEDEFDIQLLGDDEERRVGGEKFTEWKWRILPRKHGDRTLHLVVTSIFKVRGVSPYPDPHASIERTIHVQVNVGYSINELLREYLLGSIIGANLLLELVKWLVRSFYRRRQKRREEAARIRKSLTG